MFKCLNNNKGFSLVEAIVGIAITGIFFTVCVSSLNQAIYMSSQAKDYNLISQQLQNEMENLRTHNWTDLLTMIGTEEIVPDWTIEENLRDKYTFTRIVSQSKTDQLHIIMRVSWEQMQGPVESREYVTLFTKEGINDYYYRSL